MPSAGTIPNAPACLAWGLRVLEGPHVLSTGCGAGSLTIGLARAGHAVHGADHRPDALASARAALRREEGPVQHRTTFLMVEGPLPFPDESFDSVLLEDVSVPVPELQEIQRVTVAGGRVAAWLSKTQDLEALDRLAALFRLEGFEMVDGSIGLELSNAAPSPDSDQPVAQGVRDAARTLPPVVPEHDDAAIYGEPVEVAALLRSARAECMRRDALEVERAEQADELERLRARVLELERRVEVEVDLEAVRAQAEHAEAEANRLHELVRAQEHRIVESEAAAAELRSQLAQAATDARRRLESRNLKHATQLNAELAAQAKRVAEQGAALRELERQLAGSRASVRVLRERVARHRRTMVQLEQSRAHRLVTHLWHLSRRRRVLGVKAAIAGLLAVAAVVALVLGSTPAAGALGVAALVAITVLAVDVAGPLPRIVVRRLRRGRASSP